MWVDLIERTLEFTDEKPSPRIFRLWAAIALVAGALERRVWARTKGSNVYPNLYLMLVSPPGVGKTQAISPMVELWRGVKDGTKPKLHVAPDSLTRASLIDTLAKCTTKFFREGLPVAYEYNSMLLPASELGVLISAHDLDFMSSINNIYDNPPSYEESRRTLSKDIKIPYPQLNVLAGSQPQFLASILPEEAWGMGFTSRFIMIYSMTTPETDIFAQVEDRDPSPILSQLHHLTTLYGVMDWSEDAMAAMRAWAKSGFSPVPEHSKLQHYNSRRLVHCIKLVVVAAVARSGQLKIETQDVERAKGWLLEVEALMPDIFRDMVHRSDAEVINELHFFLMKDFVKDKKLVHISKISYFLQHRVPSEKIMRVIETAERSGVLVRQAGGHEWYTPQPKHLHGSE